MKRYGFALLCLLLAALGATAARAQVTTATDPPLFYRVYEYETPFRGWAEPTLWNAYIPSSRLRDEEHFGDKETRRQGLWAHALEGEYGVTDHLSLSLYADFEHGGDVGFQLIRGRVEGVYTLDTAHEHFFDTALYGEYTVPTRQYGGAQELESRVILQHDFDDLRVVFNPVVIQATSTYETKHAPTLGLYSKAYWRRHFAFQPGVELYDTFGEVGRMPGLNGQQHIIFPSADLHWNKTWWWNLGVGYGLTSGSDRLTIKSVLRYEFPTASPEKIFRRH